MLLAAWEKVNAAGTKAFSRANESRSRKKEHHDPRWG
jgi:hypothetical protein